MDWKRFTVVENPRYAIGYVTLDGKEIWEPSL
jgi:hypothetical protein